MKFKFSKSKPTTIARVKEVMQQIWDGLTTDYLCSLYESMQRRTQMVIQAEGGATKQWRIAMIYESLENIFHANKLLFKESVYF